MTEIISKPNPAKYEYEVSGLNQEFGFGYYETYGGRYSQEDALAWHILDKKDLTPENTSEQLTPEEIGHRLWTSYRELDTPDLVSGTTAATTIYDGKGHFITATLADAASFAVVYDKEGKALGVTRLNSVTHKPSDESEKQRIEAVGGQILFWGVPRVDGNLAVSRAIGDNAGELKAHGVCSEATIDITSADKIASGLGIAPDDVGFIQVINTCDGFTDGAGNDKQSKKDHEEYLFSLLKELDAPGKLSLDYLAKTLSDRALQDGSRDNVSIAIQTITAQTPAVFIGVYDGHGGIEASTKVADNIGRVFKEQCALTPAKYAKQELSVQNNKAIYERDNKWDSSLEQTYGNNIQDSEALIALSEDDALLILERLQADYNNDLNSSTSGNAEGPHAFIYKSLPAVIKDLHSATKNYQKYLNINSNECKPIVPVISTLIQILENKHLTNEEKIKQYYSFLDQPHQGSSDSSAAKNIDVIKKDTRRSALGFLTGIAIIAATLVTGVLPGLLIMGIVYAATGKTLLDLFKSYGTQFEEKTAQIKENSGLSSGFFKPAAVTLPNQYDDLSNDVEDGYSNTDRKPS